MAKFPIDYRAGGVVFRKLEQEYQFLLVTSKSHQERWIFPAGHLEPGETFGEAALREVREEAGVSALILADLGGYQYRWRRERSIFTIETKLFLMQYQDTILTNPEGRQVGFFSYETILAMNLWEEALDFLHKARQGLSQIAKYNQ